MWCTQISVRTASLGGEAWFDLGGFRDHQRPVRAIRCQYAGMSRAQWEADRSLSGSVWDTTSTQSRDKIEVQALVLRSASDSWLSPQVRGAVQGSVRPRSMGTRRTALEMGQLAVQQEDALFTCASTGCIGGSII